MDDVKAREIVGALLEQLYAKMPAELLMLEPLDEEDLDTVGDVGVPRAMRVGRADREGLVKWKLLPAAVDAEDLASLEARAGGLPALLRAWLTSRHHLFDQLRIEKGLITLPSSPSHAPLAPFRETLEAWEPLVAAGYLPFGDFEAGAGPLCFDLHARSEGDAPIVWLEHEELHALDEADWSRRARVEPHARPLFPSFHALIAAIGP